MFTKINNYLLDAFEEKITSADVQSGYLADLGQVNLKKPAVLIELRDNPIQTKSMAWKRSQYRLKIWVIVAITQRYRHAIETTEAIVGGDDYNVLTDGYYDEDNGSIRSLYAVLDILRGDPEFSSMKGTFNNKEWRIFSSNPIEYGENTQFSMTRPSSQQVSAAAVDVTINIEQRV